MYCLYIIKSLKTGKFYTEVTKDLKKRLKDHNCGRIKSTKPFRPWKLVYVEKYLNKNEAFKREFYLKSPRGYLDKKAILNSLK